MHINLSFINLKNQTFQKSKIFQKTKNSKNLKKKIKKIRIYNIQIKTKITKKSKIQFFYALTKHLT